MRDTNKLKNYREKYKRHYNIDFGRDFVVHHIDENRQNNDISNLLLLPRALHTAYHLSKTILEKADNLFEITGIVNNESKGFELAHLRHAGVTMNEVNKWYDYKRYLDGDILYIQYFSDFEKLIDASKVNMEAE